MSIMTTNSVFDRIAHLIPDAEYCDSLRIVLSGSHEPVVAKIVYCAGKLTPRQKKKSKEFLLRDSQGNLVLANHFHNLLSDVLHIPRNTASLTLNFSPDEIFCIDCTYFPEVDESKISVALEGLCFK